MEIRRDRYLKELISYMCDGQEIPSRKLLSATTSENAGTMTEVFLISVSLIFFRTKALYKQPINHIFYLIKGLSLRCKLKPFLLTICIYYALTKRFLKKFFIVSINERSIFTKFVKLG